MIVKNKKNGTNILAYRTGVVNVRVPIRAGEQVEIPTLLNFEQVINKADFDDNRGWFEIIKLENTVETESSLEKAKKEVKKYASENNENK
jgi:hypothetical protein